MANRRTDQHKLAKTAAEHSAIEACTTCKKIDKWYGAVLSSTGEKPVSGKTEKTEFRPNRIVATEYGLSKVRGIGAENEVHEKRVYGLALDFAAENEESFRTFVEEAEVNADAST